MLFTIDKVVHLASQHSKEHIDQSEVEDLVWLTDNISEIPCPIHVKQKLSKNVTSYQSVHMTFCDILGLIKVSKSGDKYSKYVRYISQLKVVSEGGECFMAGLGI